MPKKIPEHWQNLLETGSNAADVQYLVVQEKDVKKSHLDPFINCTGPIAMSATFASSGHLGALAIAFSILPSKPARCIVIEFYSKKRLLEEDGIKRNKVLVDNLQSVLARRAGSSHLYAFDMVSLVMTLYDEFGLRVVSAVDIQSSFPDPETDKVDRTPLAAVKAAIDAAPEIIQYHDKNINRAFESFTHKQDEYHDLINRAWLALFLARLAGPAEVFERVAKINTQRLSLPYLNFIAKTAGDAKVLEHNKPTTRKNEVKLSHGPDGESVLVSTRFQTKLRASSNQHIKINVGGKKTGYSLAANVGSIEGRSATVVSSTGASIENKTIISVKTVGKDDPTMAEARRAETMLRMLRGEDTLVANNPWIQNMWLNPAINEWPGEWHKGPSPKPITNENLEHLNASQRNAVKRMLSKDPKGHICLVQGPPGSGKTTVISSFVQTALKNGQNGLWLVAQSNVAVKNIAEKLAKEKFMEWRLLVSKDFQFQWNEHLYDGSLQSNVIRNDEFRVKDVMKRTQGCKVILCTLSMLSNARIANFMSVVPFRALVVDEASQIEIGDYIPCLTNSAFSSNLRSICFVGDDKQLPPFGQDEKPDLQSIFEVVDLRSRAIFLDTQYRMPPQIGEWVSDAVYDGKLNSNPAHPVRNTILATRFIDAEGTEISDGTSYKNLGECSTIVALATQLQDEGKNYRIITPYDAQRSLIEKALQNEGLNWEDKVFNVDSFQGNEEDFIVVSVVRTRALGFLQDRRRTNVMLTRCKRGLFIVTRKDFIKDGPGAASLVGKLAERVETNGGEKVWVSRKDVEDGKFIVTESNSKAVVNRGE